MRSGVVVVKRFLVVRVITGNDVNRSSSLISVRDHCEASGGCSAG